MKHEQLDVAIIDSVTVIRLQGQFIGGDETDALRDLLTAKGSVRNARVVIDFSGATYVNSAFLGVLLSTNAVVTRHRGTMTLAVVPAAIMEVIGVTKLDLVFPVFDTVEEALVTT